MTQSTARALIISNAIEGLDQLYRNTPAIEYHLCEVTADFDPDLSGYHLLIVPNGSDHIAMYRIRHKVEAFLQQGGVLFCFDGWFTNWVPGHRWVMDNSRKTIDVRYRLHEDKYGIAGNFRAEDLCFSHGISGWWSCGYIEPAPGASVLLEDNWGRALAVIDHRVTTPGIMVLTASGPAGDFSYATTDDDRAGAAMSELYQAFLRLLPERHH